MIFKTSAVRAKGAAGEATRSAGGRGAMRGGGGAAGRGGTSKDDEDKAKVEETLEDLHDFRDATGLWASDWVLQVCVGVARVRVRRAGGMWDGVRGGACVCVTVFRCSLLSCER